MGIDSFSQHINQAVTRVWRAEDSFKKGKERKDKVISQFLESTLALNEKKTISQKEKSSIYQSGRVFVGYVLLWCFNLDS